MEISDQKIEEFSSINKCKNKQKLNTFVMLQKFGRFQILSLALLSPASACIGMRTLAFVFLNIIPHYKCENQQDNMNVSAYLNQKC